MSKIKHMLLVGAACLSHSAFAITNAELARLNNQLIGLDAQLAVAKKQAELSKYTDTLPARATSLTSQTEGVKPTAASKPKATVEKRSPAQSSSHTQH